MTDQVRGWVAGALVIFMMLGLSFGSWLGRLPAVRDQLGATTLEMSLYGLCLSAGCLLGLMVSSRVVSRFGARRATIAMISVQVLALPGAAALMLEVAVPAGLALLFAYGVSYSIADVAVNVTGAGIERVSGKPRMPLLHAGYSFGAAGAMGLGALAESLGVPIELHFAAVSLLIATAIAVALRRLPQDDQVAIGSAQPALSTVTGPILIGAQAAEAAGPAAGRAAERDRRRGMGRSSWRSPRIMLIGFIALSVALVEGTASDWLPLALVDGRGFSNQSGTMLLGVFFAVVLLTRLCGSVILSRLGRVAVLQLGAAIALAGIVTVIVVPSMLGAVLGTVAWGLGSALGWPLAVSAAADDQRTAVHDVATVAVLGYGALLVGPMAFGLLGQHIGLLNSFWVLAVFLVLSGVIARAAREPAGGPPC